MAIADKWIETEHWSIMLAAQTTSSPLDAGVFVLFLGVGFNLNGLSDISNLYPSLPINISCFLFRTRTKPAMKTRL
jgi:hypothetical protein